MLCFYCGETDVSLRRILNNIMSNIISIFIIN